MARRIERGEKVTWIFDANRATCKQIATVTGIKSGTATVAFAAKDTGEPTTANLPVVELELADV